MDVCARFSGETKWISVWRKMNMGSFIFRIITVIGLCFTTLLNPLKKRELKVTTAENTGSLSAVDSLGRTVVTAGKSEKEVGVFYFLWSGEHGIYGPYDISKIVAEHPDAIESVENWEKYGGGYGSFSFWGEPLFGYYLARDKWVMRKHCQMLTDAGVDFVVFDTTNGPTYSDRAKDFIDVWYEYLCEGWNVPKIAFYTNSHSGQVMNLIYDDIYNNAELKTKYPRLNELFYEMNGKPMIIGDSGDGELRSDVRSFFRIKANQWPNDKKKQDGFPWIEFDRMQNFGAYYKNSPSDKSIMCVSCAQHCDTCRFSGTAFYGHGNDHGRSWHNGKTDTSENAILYGYNFADQWEYALKLDPDIIFVTGFNEWVAQRLNFADDEPVGFCDNCTEEYSRDFEPSAGILGDNYYMQFVNYIARFKGTTSKVSTGENVTIDINGGFEQWNNSKITAVYKDYRNDTADRDCQGFGDNLFYTDDSGRNDIINAKVTQDKDYVYFYVDTAESLTSPDGGNWMTLFINVTGKNEGYEFAVNRNAPAEGKTTVEKISGKTFTQTGNADISCSDNMLMLRVAKSDLGVTGNVSFSFKWADNYSDPCDIYSFYTTGDAAPYGRLNWVFG